MFHTFQSRLHQVYNLLEAVALTVATVGTFLAMFLIFS